MGTLVKIALVGGSLLLAWKLASSKIEEWKSKISISIKTFGQPQMTAGVLTLPVQAQIINNTKLLLPIKDLQVFLSVLRNNAWVPIGQTDPSGPFSIRPGTTLQTFVPHIDTEALNPVNDKDFLRNLTNALDNKGALLTINANVVVNIAGIQIKQSFQSALSLKDFLHARS